MDWNSAVSKGCFRYIVPFTFDNSFEEAVTLTEKQMDPEVYGGAPLLGVPGAVIITHGNSTHKGIFHAVRSGVAAVRSDVSGLIEKAIAANSDAAPSPKTENK